MQTTNYFVTGMGVVFGTFVVVAVLWLLIAPICYRLGLYSPPKTRTVEDIHGSYETSSLRYDIIRLGEILWVLIGLSVALHILGYIAIEVVGL